MPGPGRVYWVHPSSLSIDSDFALTGGSGPSTLTRVNHAEAVALWIGEHHEVGIRGYRSQSTLVAPSATSRALGIVGHGRLARPERVLLTRTADDVTQLAFFNPTT